MARPLSRQASSTATINLSNNYWGTTITTQIAAKITDHNDNSNLPTVNYTPILSTASPTGALSAMAAANTSTTYTSSSQTIALSATVTSGATNINEGNETFTILSGINIIGTPVTVNVANGVASTSSYALPAGMAAGTYTIQAIYYGTGNYLGYIDASHSLTINPAATATTAKSTSTTYSTVAQSVPLTATVTSSAGTVNGGTVTFTILNGGTTIATATSNTVTNGAAGASVTLPAGTAVNNYTIQAVYSGYGKLWWFQRLQSRPDGQLDGHDNHRHLFGQPGGRRPVRDLRSLGGRELAGPGDTRRNGHVQGWCDHPRHRDPHQWGDDFYHVQSGLGNPFDHGRLQRQHHLRHQHLDGPHPNRLPGWHDDDGALLGQSLGLRTSGRLHRRGGPGRAGHGRTNRHRHVQGWHDRPGHRDAQRWDGLLYRHGPDQWHPLDHGRL